MPDLPYTELGGSAGFVVLIIWLIRRITREKVDITAETVADAAARAECQKFKREIQKDFAVMSRELGELKTIINMVAKGEDQNHQAIHEIELKISDLNAQAAELRGRFPTK